MISIGEVEEGNAEDFVLEQPQIWHWSVCQHCLNMAGDRMSTGASKSPCKPRVNDGSLILPLARVKTIMKSSPDVENISSDALFFVTKATELFIEHIIQEIYQNAGKQKELTYNGLADIVQSRDSMEFLKDMVPRKITMREYQHLVEKEKAQDEY